MEFCVPCISPTIQLDEYIKDNLFADELRKMFQDIANENDKLRGEISELKKKGKVAKVKVEKIRCPCQTAKGEQCKKFCAEGLQTCKVHARPPKPAKQPKPPRVKRPACTGINIRGNPCRNKCIEGETFCEKHDPSKPPTTKKTKRPKKREVPVHNHAPGETPSEPCTLCQTHGDIFDPNIVKVEFMESQGDDGLMLKDRI